jgi:hypothetical protein
MLLRFVPVNASQSFQSEPHIAQSQQQWMKEGKACSAGPTATESRPFQKVYRLNRYKSGQD